MYLYLRKYLFLIICLLSVSILHAQKKSLYTPARKLQMAEYAIRSFYVDEVDENKMVEDAIVGMLKELDPHSLYSDAEEVKRMNEPLKGNFEGIGVQFDFSTDTLFVVQSLSGGPSEKAGILPGDRIIEVDDTLIAGRKMSTEDVMRRLKGPKGTEVKVGILRKGTDGLLTFNIRRDKIPVYSIDANYMLNKEVGYIRISRFAADTGKEFSAALDKLKKKGMKHLVLDLQGNGGGYLASAIEVADELLDKNQLIVYTEGRRSPRAEFKAKGHGRFSEGKLVVLVDEFSASASEIVAGTIQDWDRGSIVGRRTFGKGLVQRPIELFDGSMIRLTIARYYTPSGRCIQKPYNNHEDYTKDLISRYEHGEMMHADSIHFPDSLKYRTLNLGRTVYGGGGIMPDYFVPIDTTLFTDYYTTLRDKGVIVQENVSLIDQFREVWMAEYQTFDRFNEKFEVTDDLLGRLLRRAEAMKIPFNEEQYMLSLPLIRTQMKALIARDLWDMNEYYHVINQLNNSLLRAKELIENLN